MCDSNNRVKGMSDNLLWFLNTLIICVTILALLCFAGRCSNEQDRIKAEIEKTKMQTPGYRLVEIK